MNKADWIFALILIITGLTCLVFSANSFGHESLAFFGQTLFHVCRLALCPVVLVVFIYLLFYFKKRR